MMKRVQMYFYLFLLLCSILSIFLIGFPYISISISGFALFLSLFCIKKSKRMIFTISTICISTIITDLFVITKEKEIKDDIFNDTNILLGTWVYNDNGGYYVFNDDFSYIQHDNSDNYCVGNYNYSYGGTGKDGTVIKMDDSYYYYDLFMEVDYCIINGKNKPEVNNPIFIFGINKKNYNDLIFINKDDDYAFKVAKVIN